MELKKFLMLSECIPYLTARESLREIGTFSYPWMKDVDQKKTWDRLSKQAEAKQEKIVFMKDEDVAAHLSNLMGGG